MGDILFNLMATLGLDTTEFEKGVSGIGEKAASVGNAISSGMKTAGVAMAAVGTAAMAAGGAILKNVGDVASYGDSIDKASQKMGISAKAYQEWDAVLQHSGTSIDSMSRGMLTLQKNAANNAEKFKELGLSQKQVAEMSTEDLFAATIKGLQEMGDGAERTALASELLGGSAKELGPLLNTSAEDTQAMRDRVNELGGVMSDEAVKAAAAYQDSLQDMSTAFDGLKRNLSSSFLPSLTTVMDGLTEVFSGNYDEGVDKISEGVDKIVENMLNTTPKFLEVGLRIIETLATSLIENVPKIFPALTELALNIVQTLVEQLPVLAQSGIQIITTLADGIAASLPTMIPTIIDVVLQIVDTLIDNVDALVDGAIALMEGILEGIIEATPKIIEKMPELIMKMADAIVRNIPKIVESFNTMVTKAVEFLKNNLPKFLEKGKDLIINLADGFVKNLPQFIEGVTKMITNFVSTIGTNLPTILEQGIKIIAELAAGLIKAIPEIIKAIPQIIKAIVETFSKYNWLDIGKNIIKGIANGISGAIDTIVSAAKDAAKAAFDAAKNFLGIKSPSRLMRDGVGRFISEGIAVGIDEHVDSIIDSMGEIADLVSEPIVPNVGDFGITSTGERIATGGNYNASNAITINVYGAQGQNVEELAEIVSNKINNLVASKRRTFA